MEDELIDQVQHQNSVSNPSFAAPGKSNNKRQAKALFTLAYMVSFELKKLL